MTKGTKSLISRQTASYPLRRRGGRSIAEVGVGKQPTPLRETIYLHFSSRCWIEKGSSLQLGLVWVCLSAGPSIRSKSEFALALLLN